MLFTKFTNMHRLTARCAQGIVLVTALLFSGAPLRADDTKVGTASSWTPDGGKPVKLDPPVDVYQDQDGKTYLYKTEEGKKVKYYLEKGDKWKDADGASHTVAYQSTPELDHLFGDLGT